MNYEPHVHEPNLVQKGHWQQVENPGITNMGITHDWVRDDGWILQYGDTKVEIPGPAQPTADQRRTALLAAIQEHDEGSKHEYDLFAAVSKLKGKKVWASDVLAAPPRKHWWQKAAV